MPDAFLVIALTPMAAVGGLILLSVHLERRRLGWGHLVHFPSPLQSPIANPLPPRGRGRPTSMSCPRWTSPA